MGITPLYPPPPDPTPMVVIKIPKVFFTPHDQYLIYPKVSNHYLDYFHHFFYLFAIISPDPAPRGRIKILKVSCNYENPYLSYPKVSNLYLENVIIFFIPLTLSPLTPPQGVGSKF